MAKSTMVMRYSYEQCTAKDKKHDDTLVYEADGVTPKHWLCSICGRKAGLMRVN